MIATKSSKPVLSPAWQRSAIHSSCIRLGLSGASICFLCRRRAVKGSTRAYSKLEKNLRRGDIADLMRINSEFVDSWVPNTCRNKSKVRFTHSAMQSAVELYSRAKPECSWPVAKLGPARPSQWQASIHRARVCQIIGG